MKEDEEEDVLAQTQILAAFVVPAESRVNVVM